MPLTEFGEQELRDLTWENLQLKNAIVKHFLGVDLDKKPSQRIISAGEQKKENDNDL